MKCKRSLKDNQFNSNKFKIIYNYYINDMFLNIIHQGLSDFIYYIISNHT